MDVTSLRSPRPAPTNNDCESQSRGLLRRLLRATSQIGASHRLLQREGACELIPHPDSLTWTIVALAHMPAPEFHLERRRLLLHRQRFRFHTRSGRQAQTQLQRLEKRWLSIPFVPVE